MHIQNDIADMKLTWLSYWKVKYSFSKMPSTNWWNVVEL